MQKLQRHEAKRLMTHEELLALISEVQQHKSEMDDVEERK